MSHGKGGKKSKRGGGGPDRPTVVLVVISPPTDGEATKKWGSLHGAAMTAIALFFTIAGATGYLTNTSSVNQLIARQFHFQKTAVPTSVASAVNDQRIARNSHFQKTTAPTSAASAVNDNRFALATKDAANKRHVPVNFLACTNSGGVTWYDYSAGRGGCLGRGANRQFNCGTWNYSKPGRGKYRSWDGFEVPDLAWIASDEAGNCELGFA